MTQKEEAQFLLNNTYLWEKIKEKEEIIENLCRYGIKTKEEEELARAICSFALSNIYFEAAIKKSLPDPICKN